ncbi:MULTISPECIES: 3-isopropylmalate dehydratase small subunit [unclassified Motilimonas]|uniref:3-isopropylmalate dehydratase small subunit n=1 Tax=Motilimonas TaxID=1914248 RepID=UPI001E40B1FB|nr:MULTISPECIES: 3-isopropylmalate dehydratase small subunit [unclassified Motilimonas]MCE0556960.1 3-isopropylmalate dehydratase small subunit [Motilimonas sp. E26]MDO6525489.1 3-isopropylmalate dehydratase small subunit [Motilimonas sp. 1_MG-2023]
MQPYKKHTSIAALMDRSNVDTDQIIPKQFLKKVERTGFGIHLFHDWRFLDDGITPNPDFELNNPAFKGAKILVAGDNFGCGSSREHAPWAIEDYGFNTVISTSFADIFFSNCFKNGIIPIKVTPAELDSLMDEIRANEGVEFTVDLEAEKLTTPGGIVIKIEVDAFRKQSLLEGLDDIAWSLKHEDKITAFEEKHKQQLPWLWK